MICCSGGSATVAPAPVCRGWSASNNGMQRSADTQAVVFLQRGRAPADAGRYIASSMES